MTWAPAPVDGGGIHARMEHDGFVLPDDRIAHEAMNPGWGRVPDGIARVIAEAARDVRQTRNAFVRR